jgi:hypothetical protein
MELVFWKEKYEYVLCLTCSGHGIYEPSDNSGSKLWINLVFHFHFRALFMKTRAKIHILKNRDNCYFVQRQRILKRKNNDRISCFANSVSVYHIIFKDRYTTYY